MATWSLRTWSPLRMGGVNDPSNSEEVPPPWRGTLRAEKYCVGTCRSLANGFCPEVDFTFVESARRMSFG